MQRGIEHWDEARRRAERLAQEIEALVLATPDGHPNWLVARLSRRLFSRDEETGNHLRRVAHLARLIARELGSDAAFCRDIFLAAPLHDFGKLAIPGRILHKPGPLTTAEWRVMQTHTTIGYEMLKTSRVAALRLGAEVALAHHEHYDGGGYPRGLRGEAIPLCGRIVAVADELDALLSARPYKRAWSWSAALESIERDRERRLDPRCVDAMYRCLPAIVDVERAFADSASGRSRALAGG